MASKSFEKIVDEIGNLTVLELADLIKALEGKFGVSAAMPMAAAPAAGAAPVAAAQEKTEFKVTLKSAGAEKIKVIKALRVVIPSLSLSDAKQKSENTPVLLAPAASKEDADKMKKELEAAGAEVEIS